MCSWQLTGWYQLLTITGKHHPVNCTQCCLPVIVNSWLWYHLVSLPKAHSDVSTGMHQQSALLIGFGCCCCHSKHSFPLKGSSHVDRFPFHDHKQAKVTDMKSEEDVSDEFVCISAKKKVSTIINKEGSSTYQPVYTANQYNYNRTHVLIDIKCMIKLIYNPYR